MQIGTHNIDRPLLLAPMDDVTDPPFRRICKEFGADIVYTEFANSEALIRNVASSTRRLEVHDAERPVGIQIYGSVPESMADAARMAQEAGPDFIDINAGCWVKKVVRRGDGAGLLRDLDQFERVVRAVVEAVDLPVTVKTRLGWDGDHIVIREVARMVQDCGAQALAVHCRTRVQGYKGQADWSWLPRIREVCAIPLIGNGDVKTPQDVRRLFELGCDGIMIGRAAITNPWLFRQARHYLATGEVLPEPTLRERIDVCLRHLKDRAEYHGERRAVLQHRKHYAAYLRGVRNAAKVRASLMEFTEIAPIEERLKRFAQCVENDAHPPD